jgi:histidinol-phosphate phosphatase family protein
MRRKAVFLDRDGTICEDVHYMRDPSQLRIYPEVPKAIKLLNEAGFLVIIATNQSAVARGYVTLEGLERIHKKMLEELGKRGAKIDAIYFCPHHPDDNCNCRKPKPGMILKAQRDFNIDLKASYIVGDKRLDVETAEKTNLIPILVLTGYGKEELKTLNEWRIKPAYIAKNLLDATRWIRILKI